MKIKLKVFITVGICFFSLLSFGGSMPKTDSKMKEGERIQKCADWAKDEVSGTSDAKKKASEFKEKFQTCLTKNGLSSSHAFSGKYKP